MSKYQMPYASHERPDGTERYYYENDIAIKIEDLSSKQLRALAKKLGMKDARTEDRYIYEKGKPMKFIKGKKKK